MSGSAGDGRGRARCSTTFPLVSSTLIVESFGSGRSPNVMVTAVGAVARFAPALGSDDCGSACAVAEPARRSVATSARPAATLLRAMPIGRLRPAAGATPRRHEEAGGTQDHAEPAEHDGHDERGRGGIVGLRGGGARRRAPHRSPSCRAARSRAAAAGEADATAATRASSRSSRVVISVSDGSLAGNWMSVASTTELNVESLDVAVSSTAVSWILPDRWNV